MSGISSSHRAAEAQGKEAETVFLEAIKSKVPGGAPVSSDRGEMGASDRDRLSVGIHAGMVFRTEGKHGGRLYEAGS